MKSLFVTGLLLGLLIRCGTDGDSGAANDPTPVIETALAFPGAEGFGRDASGGRGGKVLLVTNLQDSGPGSLRSAIQTSGARYILFTVSGTIQLKSALTISQGDVTIAGQTAPGDGICIRDYPVTIAADNVIIRFLRFRMGDVAKQEGDALGARFHKNIIIDHCSMSWSTDECVSLYANENTTVQWCIIAESLRNSVHFKGAHGYGGIWGGKNASFHHNLLAHHDSRNPRLGEEAGKAFALTDLVDIRNNVIYNWGSNSTYGGEAMNANLINNYYRPGPATLALNSESKQGRIYSIDKNKIMGTDVYDTWGHYFIDGNVVEGHPTVSGDNWTYGVFNQFHASYTSYTAPCTDASGADVACTYTIPVSDTDKNNMKRTTAFTVPGVTTHAADIAYARVVAYAGTSHARDAVDTRIVQNVQMGTYTYEGSNGSTNGIIDSQTDVGGWPALISLSPPDDSDLDGMPDAWEISKRLNATRANATDHNLSTGYDNLEVYLHELVATIVNAQNQ